MPSIYSSRLCLSVIGPTYADLIRQIKHASVYADWIEIRLDRLEKIDWTHIQTIKACSPLPLVWTIRKVSQGGNFSGTLEEQFTLLKQLMAYQPDFVDLEADLPLPYIKTLQNLSSHTKWIISWHEPHGTPADLNPLAERLFSIPGHYYKLATYAHSTLDALRLLVLSKEINQSQSRFCAIGMGEMGHCTRILAPLVKQPMTFASLEDGQEAAPGQLSAQTLIQTYHFPKLNDQTQLFGLIGCPVDKSMSHLTHNAVFRRLALNAVYVKFNVREEELPSFFSFIRLLPIRGLSVTMPHKELVKSWVSHFPPEGACNTLLFVDGEIRAYNTDGLGALKTLAIPSVENKKIVILGAGGTARAIAHEAKRKGALVTIVNRTPQRAQALADQLNSSWKPLEQMAALSPEEVDILIQATSVGMAPYFEHMPIPPDWIPPYIHVLEAISNPPETRFLQEARQRGCQTYPGANLFVHQAVQQFVHWFGEGIDQDLVEKIIRQHHPGFKAEQKSIKVKKSLLKGSIALPPSKSHSIRAILLGAMTEGESRVKYPLSSPDVQQAIEAAIQLGAQMTRGDQSLTIKGVGGRPATPKAVIDAGNSGQVLRFVGALAALSEGYTILTGDPSICSNRPAQPLLDGLSGLGAWAVSTQQNGYAPLVIKGPLKPGSACLNGQDSQPVSGLLMAAAFVEGETQLTVHEAGEKPWIALTLAWLDRLGVDYTHQNYEKFVIKGKQKRPSFQIEIPGDFSSAAFPLVAALITQSELTIERADMEDIQGDKAIIPLLQQMGACIEIDKAEQKIHIKKGECITGKEIDVNPFIDAVPILAVLGCFAEGETRLVNGSIARYKECNRLACIVAELKKMGAQIEETEDGIHIRSSKLKGARVQSYHDHRMALALMVAGLASEGTTEVEGAECIHKSYATFIEDMQRVGANLYAN